MPRFTSDSTRPTRRLTKALALATTTAVPSLVIIAGQIPAIAANIRMH